MSAQLPARYYSRYPFESPSGLIETKVDLNLDRTAFLLVDVLGPGHDPGDAIPDYPPLFLKHVHELQTDMLTNAIRPAVHAARSIGLPIVYVQNRWHSHAWEGSEFAALVERTECGHVGSFNDVAVNENSQYTSYSALLAPEPTDYFVEKTMYDGFFETTLDTVLRNLNIKHLVAVGFSAEICFLATVIGAMYRNYQVTVLRDAVLGSEFTDSVQDMAMTQWAIRYYEALVGFTSTVPQFLDVCATVREGQNAHSSTI
jgi:nicotinamidase-related amidase